MTVRDELKEALEGKKKQPNLNILSIPEFKDIERGLRRTGNKLDKLGDQDVENTNKVTGMLEKLGKALGLIQEEIRETPKPPKPLEEIKVKNFPKTTKVEKPEWYKAPDSKEITIPLAKAIGDAVERLATRVGKVHITNQEPEDAVAVRLTSKDGRKFYNAIVGAISAAGAVFPFINTKGNKQEALTDTDGHLQVDVLSAPIITVIGNVGHDITGMADGVKTVSSAGTDEALAGSTVCKRVVIQAQSDNQNIIAVGATGVDATISTGTGVILFPGDAIDFEIDNLADIFIDAITSGEGVRFTYFT